MKLSASTPRVTRSPIPERGQAVVLNGESFEDGRQRIVVGYDVTPEDARELGRILDARDAEQDRLTALIEKVNALMSTATGSNEPCPACNWTGPQTQYLGIERTPITHPSGPHERDWLTTGLSEREPGDG